MACNNISTLYVRKFWRYTCYFINWGYISVVGNRTFQPFIYYISPFLNLIFKTVSLNNFHCEKMRKNFRNVEQS